MVIGYQDKKAFRGRIGGVNVWSTLLNKHSIVSMMRGNGRESGTVISWKQLERIIPAELSLSNEALHLQYQGT